MTIIYHSIYFWKNKNFRINPSIHFPHTKSKYYLNIPFTQNVTSSIFWAGVSHTVHQSPLMAYFRLFSLSFIIKKVFYDLSLLILDLN
jgi:hypothetical protein